MDQKITDPSRNIGLGEECLSEKDESNQIEQPQVDYSQLLDLFKKGNLRIQTNRGGFIKEDVARDFIKWEDSNYGSDYKSQQ